MLAQRAALLAGSASLAVLGLATPTAQAGSGSARPMPLEPPPGHRLVATFPVGNGSQIYECIADTTATGGTWRGRPVASLVEPRRHGVVVGTHDSVSSQGTAPVPQWSLIEDGSRVVGRLATGGSFPAPDPTKAIAALRLDVVQNSGVGVLADVDTIQRDLVRGGVGPTGACTPSTDQPVVSRYTARYTFWAKDQ